MGLGGSGRPSFGRQRKPARTWVQVMLYWALGFFVVALLAGVLGFSGIASASAGIAQVLFFVFLVLLVTSLVVHVLGVGADRPRPRSRLHSPLRS